MTRTPLAQLASAQRGVLRCGSLLAAIGESPNAPANIENAVKAVLFLLKPRGVGGVSVCPHSRRLYEAAQRYERADGSIGGADLQRVADELGLPPSVSRKPAKLQQRYDTARDASEMETVLSWIETSAPAQEAIRLMRAELACLDEARVSAQRELEEARAELARLRAESSAIETTLSDRNFLHAVMEVAGNPGSKLAEQVKARARDTLLATGHPKPTPNRKP